jgi:Pectin methylesterase
MVSSSSFYDAQQFIVNDVAELLTLCSRLREGDPLSPYRIIVKSSLNEEIIKFPFSNFLIEAAEGPVVITGSLYAKMKDEKGEELTTWKTATMKVTGSHNVFIGLEIRNEAGDPGSKGQEVALGIYGDDNLFLNCRFSSTQDTLFVGPLSRDLQERYKGFLPDDERECPHELTNYFSSCRIEGSVDFIFGAGNAFFDRCEIVSVDDGRKEGYVAAPSTEQENPGGFFLPRMRVRLRHKRTSHLFGPALARLWQSGLCLLPLWGPHQKGRLLGVVRPAKEEHLPLFGVAFNKRKGRLGP